MKKQKTTPLFADALLGYIASLTAYADTYEEGCGHNVISKIVF